MEIKKNESLIIIKEEEEVEGKIIIINKWSTYLQHPFR